MNKPTSTTQKRPSRSQSTKQKKEEGEGASMAFYFFAGTIILSALALLAALFLM